MARIFPRVLAILLICLVVADVIGVVICTLLDVAPLRHKSALLPFAIWFVLGVFTGLIAYNASGAWASPKSETDWTNLPGAAAIGNRIVGASAVIVLILAALFHYLFWARGVAGEYFVPDSAPHTLVFLASTLGAMLVGRFALMPAKVGSRNQ